MSFGVIGTLLHMVPSEIGALSKVHVPFAGIITAECLRGMTYDGIFY